MLSVAYQTCTDRDGLLLTTVLIEAMVTVTPAAQGVPVAAASSSISRR